MIDDEEQMARGMADSIFGAALEDFDDDVTKEQADRLYDQCLADAWRMLLDPDCMRHSNVPGFWKPFAIE